MQSREGLQKLWDASREHWGTVDIWISNAGRNTPHSPVWETGESYTRQVIGTNILGMVFGAQIAAAEMIRQGHGAIWAMEGLGSNNMIQPKTILYGTTKHALTYFMKGLARELEGSGVTAGRLSPGMMLTDFITKTRTVSPRKSSMTIASGRSSISWQTGLKRSRSISSRKCWAIPKTMPISSG